MSEFVEYDVIAEIVTFEEKDPSPFVVPYWVMENSVKGDADARRLIAPDVAAKLLEERTQAERLTEYTLV